ncbi:hypothetical protein Tco_1274800, partial [Tanacetum coccineum]
SRLGYLNAYGISQLKNRDTTASASNPLLAHYNAQGDVVSSSSSITVHPLEGLVSVDSDDHDDEIPRNAQKQVLDELDELMSKSKVNQLQDAKEKLIMIIIFEFLNDDYDVFGDKLRKKIQAYEPFVSIPLLTIIFTYTPGSLEGFGERYKYMGRKNSSVSGLVVGYIQLKDVIDTIIIDRHVLNFANRDRRERWKPHLVIIIVMVLEGRGNKGKVLHYDDMLTDRQAKGEAKADDKANQRKQDELRIVGP